MWPSFYHCVIGTEFRSGSHGPGNLELFQRRSPRTFCAAGARRRNSPTARVFLLSGEGAIHRFRRCPATPGEMLMDEDRIKGSAEQVKGKVKEVAGKLSGDSKLEGEGKADQVAGK